MSTFFPIRKKPCHVKIMTGHKDHKPVYIEFKGLFHGWGTEVLEDHDNMCSMTVGIVEREDKSIELVYPGNITFE